jgi:hypothetical protein
VVFQYRQDERYELASVAKIYILLAYLDRLSHEQRIPTPDEIDQMRTMIEESGNEPATELFDAIGRHDGIAAFLAAHSLPPIDAAEDGSWGSMRASPLDVGHLLLDLYQGRILDLPATSLAFSLLANVIHSQAWGVGAVLDGGAVKEVYLKNGWYPGPDGWIVNSVGIAAEPKDSYAIVILSDTQPSFEEGIAQIEDTVGLIRGVLFKNPPQLSVTSTPEPVIANATPDEVRPRPPTATPDPERTRLPVPRSRTPGTAPFDVPDAGHQPPIAP